MTFKKSTVLAGAGVLAIAIAVPLSTSANAAAPASMDALAMSTTAQTLDSKLGDDFGGAWIEKGRLVHPVHEVTIAGNLKQMLMDVDAVGSDLVWRSSSASPTIRIRRMTVSGS